MPYEVTVYQTENGGVPYEESFNGLRNEQAKTIIMRRIQRAQLGNLGDHKSLNGGLHEMRIDFGEGYRIYFGWTGQEIILLFLAGKKSNQQADIKTSRAYLEDFRKRKHD